MAKLKSLIPHPAICSLDGLALLLNNFLAAIASKMCELFM